MSNIIILGNGFDMAHNLKTSYTHFMEYLVKGKYDDPKRFEDLFQFEFHTMRFKKTFKEIKENSDFGRYPFESKNKLFLKLTKRILDVNWCDIENEYFGALKSIGSNGGYESAKALNKDFETIKKYLEGYLKMEQDGFVSLKVFIDFFKGFNRQDTLVLNFNYTHLSKEYLKRCDKIKGVNIHGEIESLANPIIFGFAANDDESRVLLAKGDKEFLRNIKKQNYKRTSQESILLDFLRDKRKIEVSILGHSCGISDKLILNEIFNHKNVDLIRVYYYEEYEHYFETQVNIDRIMDNDINFKKLVNFEDSVFIPQSVEPDRHWNFTNLSKSIIDDHYNRVDIKIY